MIKHKKYDYLKNHQMVYKIEKDKTVDMSLKFMGFDKDLRTIYRTKSVVM